MKNRGLPPFYTFQMTNSLSPFSSRFLCLSPFSRFLRPASASGRRLPTTLEVSVVETQLGNQQGVTFNLVHHAVLIGYAP